jgi:hypothetical protein
LFATLFILCGKANFVNMSRYSSCCDRTYRRQYDQPFDFTAFNAATIAMAIPEHREQILAIDASFINKSGKCTWGLDWFYNGCQGKAEKGLEISAIVVVDVVASQGYTLSVTQTTARPQVATRPKQPTQGEVASTSERVKGYISQLQAAKPHLPSSIQYLAADSFYSKKSFVDSVCALNLHLISKLRKDANLRYLYTGKQKARGAHRKYGEKVLMGALSQMELVGEVEPGVTLYTQVVWHVSLKRCIRLAYLVNANLSVSIALFSTDLKIDPRKIYSYYKARFQIEFVFRDAKQFTGLGDCQSRQKARLSFHFNASLSALNLAKVEMSKSLVEEGASVRPISLSMNNYHRRAHNQYLMEIFISMLGLDQTLIKSHPNYEKCLQHGSMSF